MTVKSTTETRSTTASTTTRRAETPRAPEPVKTTPLDRRAQRNLQNLRGTSSFSSPSLQPVGATPAKFTTPVVAAKSPAEVEQRGFDAIKTIQDVQLGVLTRTEALAAANEKVKASETTLAEHLKHLEHALSTEELQAYADDFRADEPAYAEATAAAQELASYVADNTGRLAQAEADVRAYHPQPEAYETVMQGAPLTRRALEDAALALEEHVALSPTGSPELKETLSGISAGTVSMGAAVAEQVAGVAELIPRFKSLAERAGGAFGVVGGLVDGKTFLDRVLKDGQPEDYAGLAASGVLVTQGVMKVAGVAVSAPVSLAAGAVSLVASGVGAWRDNEARVADMSARLAELGIDSAVAETISRGNPASFGELAKAGFSPEQVQRLAALGESWLLSTHESDATYFARATASLGLTPEESVRLLERLGPDLASSAGHTLAALDAGGAKSREAILSMLAIPNGVFGVSEDTRVALLRELEALR